MQRIGLIRDLRCAEISLRRVNAQDRSFANRLRLPYAFEVPNAFTRIGRSIRSCRAPRQLREGRGGVGHFGRVGQLPRSAAGKSTWCEALPPPAASAIPFAPDAPTSACPASEAFVVTPGSADAAPMAAPVEEMEQVTTCAVAGLASASKRPKTMEGTKIRLTTRKLLLLTC